MPPDALIQLILASPQGRQLLQSLLGSGAGAPPPVPGEPGDKSWPQGQSPGQLSMMPASDQMIPMEPETVGGQAPIPPKPGEFSQMGLLEQMGHGAQRIGGAMGGMDTLRSGAQQMAQGGMAALAPALGPLGGAAQSLGRGIAGISDMSGPGQAQAQRMQPAPPPFAVQRSGGLTQGRPQSDLGMAAGEVGDKSWPQGQSPGQLSIGPPGSGGTPRSSTTLTMGPPGSGGSPGGNVISDGPTSDYRVGEGDMAYNIAGGLLGGGAGHTQKMEMVKRLAAMNPEAFYDQDKLRAGATLRMPGQFQPGANMDFSRYQGASPTPKRGPLDSHPKNYLRGKHDF